MTLESPDPASEMLADDASAVTSALKLASVNGAAVSLGGQAAKFILVLAYQVIMAHLLAPEAFGLLAMVAPVLTFAQLFNDLGLSQATVQAASITHRQLSTLFWLNVAISTALTILTIAVAPLVGVFYGEPRTVALTAALGLTIIGGGLTAQHMAIFNRNFRFVSLAVIDIVSFTIGAIASVVSAWHGLGYWSLVVNPAVAILTSVVLCWSILRWWPGRPHWDAGTGTLVAFGRNLTGFNLVNYFARNLDNILLGKYWGDIALGLYDRSYKLMLYPLGQIATPLTRVAIPLLARTSQTPELYTKAFSRMLESVLLMTFPAVCCAFVMSDAVVRFGLGEAWTPATPIFTILALGALFAPIGNSTGWLFISQGRTQSMMVWGSISSALFVASFLIGLPWGPVGVAASYIGIGIAIQGPMMWWAATKEGPVGLRHFLTTICPFFVAAVILISVLAIGRLIAKPTLLTLALSLAVSYPIFILALGTSSQGRFILKQINKTRALLFKSPNVKARLKRHANS